MKLNDAASDAMPSTCRDRIHTSMPCPALYVMPVSGEYPNQPPLGAEWVNQLSFSISAPARNVQ